MNIHFRPAQFLLKPGEELQDGVQQVYVLGENEGLVIRAIEASSVQYTVCLVCGWCSGGPMPGVRLRYDCRILTALADSFTGAHRRRLREGA